MTDIKTRRSKNMTAVSVFLCVVFVLSSVMASFAWSDFTQSKTNIFRGNVEKADVVLNLYEKDANGVIQADPVSPIMNARFMLYRIEPDGTETQIDGGPWYTDANGQIVFDGRDSGHPRLEAGKYVFVETKTAFGYTYDKDSAGADITRYEFEVTQADISAGRRVNVTAYNRRGGGTLAVKKTVEGNPPESDEFTYTVVFSDGGAYSCSIDGGEKITVASGGSFKLKHGQTALFEDVPIGVQYRVTEAAQENYIISANGHQGNITDAGSVAAFVNTYDTELPDPEEKVTLTVKKTLAGEYPAKDEAKEFSFTLIVDGEEISFTLKPGGSRDFEVSAGSQYEVLEENYFTDEYLQRIINGYGTVGAEDILVEVTNTFAGDPVVDIEGEKTWVTGGDAALPESITVQLKNGDALVLEKTVKPDANGDWKYSFTVPKYDAAGKEIKYTVEELAVPYYTPAYNGYDIKNTYVQPVTGDPPVVTKVVRGEDTPDTKFAFVMKGLNGAPMPQGAAGDSKTVYLTGSGEVEFGDIQFTNAGVYTYEIYENGTGEAGWTYDKTRYTLTFTVTEANGRLSIADKRLESAGAAASEVIFTNSYTQPVADTVTVAGKKNWEHGANPEANRPGSVTVYVYADGEQVIQWQVTQADNWSYSFELPKYTPAGKEIKYTVGEKDVAGYTKRIEGYNITNTYTGGQGSQGSQGTTSGTDDTPGTGDYTNLTLWFVLMLVSGVMLIVVSLLRTRGYKGKHCKR